MSAKANYFKLGIFVIITTALFVVSIVGFARPRMQNPLRLETYMDESISGLDVGSQIFYRGVKIGMVEDIDFASSRYGSNARFGRYVVIDMVIESTKLLGQGSHPIITEQVDNLVESGLRIRVSSNPLTGLSNLEADYPIAPGEPLDFDWQPRHHYIPSDKSVLNKFSQTAHQAFESLEKVDFVGLIEKLDTLLVTVEQAVKGANIEQISKKTEDLLVEITETAKAIKLILATEDGQPKIRIEDVLERIEEVLGLIEKLALSQSPDIDKIVDDFSEFAENAKELSEELKKNPSILLKKPAKSEVMK